MHLLITLEIPLIRSVHDGQILVPDERVASSRVPALLASTRVVHGKVCVIFIV